MKRIWYILLLVAFISCKKKDSDPQIVAKFVAEVKADNYLSQQLPNFTTGHIDALFRHAADGQLVNRYPWPSYLSFYPGQKEVGLVMLFAIEEIRQPQSSPTRGAHILDMNNPERKVTLSEVLPLYQAWWAENKGKSAVELRQSNPLEGAGLVWFGTSIALE